jgi:hypothetical protein
MRDEEGMSLVEIAAELSKRYDDDVTPNAISVALSRAGKTGPHKKHTDTLPWTVRNEHTMGYPARMLRLLGRRRSNQPLTDNDTRLLDSWLRRLADANLVVAYSRDIADGWLYVDAIYGDPARGIGDPDIPIRSRPVTADEIDEPVERYVEQ